MKTQIFLAIALATMIVPQVVNAKSVKNANSAEFKMHEHFEVNTDEETSLKIEAWMINNTFWRLNTPSSNIHEDALKIEEWMTNDDFWHMNNNTTENISVDKKEKELKIEQWMINDDLWHMNQKASERKSVNKLEAGIKIEKWMTDDEVWKYYTSSSDSSCSISL